MKLEILFLAELFFPKSGLFPREKIQNSAKIMLLRVNLSLQKYTFVKMGQNLWVKVDLAP